jgi:hypothetical protein
MAQSDNSSYKDAEHKNVAARDADDVTVEALGKLSEALETIERARGRLYDFHQFTGMADFALDDAVALFERAGHNEAAQRIRDDLIGKDVLNGRWTFQIIEEYNDGYYRAFTDVERDLRNDLGAGVRHHYEAALKLRRQRDPKP